MIFRQKSYGDSKKFPRNYAVFTGIIAFFLICFIPGPCSWTIRHCCRIIKQEKSVFR